MEREEAVILVVGGEKEKKSKALVADALAEARGASRLETTKAGARIFSRESSSAPVVVDTTALVTWDGWYVQDDAMVWISSNFLRQMCDKLIFVVCVVASTGAEDPVHRKHEFLDTRNTWLQALALIFKQHLPEIMVLVKLEGTDNSQSTKSAIVNFLSTSGFAKSNVSFVVFTREYLDPSIKSALESSSVYPVTNAKGKRGKVQKASIAAPFRVTKATANSKAVDRHGPWGPTPVILFGRTGSGKSTLAQMLTRGRLNANAKDFAASSSIRGETTKLSAGEGRSWYVVDTPGFGEPDNSESAVSTGEAEKKLKRYVQGIQGHYCHFLYVVMKDRMDQLEESLWKFFVLLFGNNISDNFTVIISNADQAWVDRNKVHLQSIYEGCESFLGVEFPPIKTEDKEWETELEEVRTSSLRDLEEELAYLCRCPVACDFGFFSKKNIESGIARIDLDVRSAGDHVIHKAAAFGMGMRFAGIGRLMRMLRREEKLLLLPC